MKPVKKSAALPAWAFPEITRPSYTDSLSFPENLPNLSSTELGLIHGRYTGLLAYAASELSKVSVEKLRIETGIGKEFNRRVVALSIQNVQKWKINNVVESSLPMIELKDKLLELNVKIETLRTFKENFERYCAALSREMSRRASEFRAQ